jgi:hypothetical protein
MHKDHPRQFLHRLANLFLGRMDIGLGASWRRVPQQTLNYQDVDILVVEMLLPSQLADKNQFNFFKIN